MNIIAVAIVMLSLTAQAGSYDDAKSKRYRFDWKINKANVIDTDSVCRQYQKGTLSRRFCREQAREHFDGKCNTTKGEEKIKYCFAAQLHPAR
ncbi:hypothetical protein [Motilimonas cestriensis]|uniref:hypothetical protein n=1 Tax=Motilimonas cestriensis TaxID=2742685 RepID=UPI003DA286AE